MSFLIIGEQPGTPDLEGSSRNIPSSLLLLPLLDLSQTQEAEHLPGYTVSLLSASSLGVLMGPSWSPGPETLWGHLPHNQDNVTGI